MTNIEEVDGVFISSREPRPFSASLAERQDAISPSSKSPERILYSTAQTRSFMRLTSESRKRKDAGDMPVAGRESIAIQTDLYIEDLCDGVVEADKECQTPLYLGRPPPPFVPKPSGDDKWTQVFTGELFDFDSEARPVVECLVNQSLEQAMIDYSSEQELLALSKAQKEFELQRNAELADRFRLEERERRVLEEKRLRIKEQEEAVKLEEETAEKIAACVYAQNYLSELMPKVYKRLEKQGYLVTQIEIQDVEEDFWPWLMNEVDSNISVLQASCSILDHLIEEAVGDITKTSIFKPVTPQVSSTDLLDGF